MLLTLTFVVILAGLAVAMIVRWRQGRQAGGPQRFDPSLVQGTLTVTGVSDRPEVGDKNGQMFCTISGTVLGPQTAPTDVYQRMVLPDDQPWPQVGDDLPVVYRAGKVETSWRIGTLAPPPSDEPPSQLP
ncbi:hypothetical protein [Williamsia sterculiae]|uniref:Uncharacterized protein n=1 Tax=Williamsia sterculiae TaxID=1344003 RepID=A0A1N7FVV9_9NOCA|nr:hypothetical protein [Williamsia sterculiae]SIS04375.1 hypothetical protein SAMN05445060_2329 [Williamsia sterculiae]